MSVIYLTARLRAFRFAGTTLREDGHVMRIKPKTVAATAVESSDASDASGGGPVAAAAAAAVPAESWTPEKKDLAGGQQQTSTTTTTTTTMATTTAGTSIMAAVAVAMAKSAVEMQRVRPLRELLGCQDKTNRRRTAQRGDYWVLYNYVPARKWFRCDESITYTTHADFTFLDNLEPLVDRSAYAHALLPSGPTKRESDGGCVRTRYMLVCYVPEIPVSASRVSAVLK